MSARLPCVLLAWALAGCGQSPAAAAPPSGIAEARSEVAEATSPMVATVQEATAAAVVPAVVALQEIVQEVAPPSSNAAHAATVSPAAVALIVRWEVGSASRYARRYQAPIWPGGASGVTWGIGYDGGHQTRQQIGLDWSAHDASSRLQATAGITGRAARPLVLDLRNVTVPYGMASDVFALASLPRYQASARRAFGVERFDALPADAQGALVSLVYNRGASMTGPARAEMRAIRDTCLLGADVHCVAGQIRQMCRLWRGTNLEAGLCGRREDEAVLTERAR